MKERKDGEMDGWKDSVVNREKYMGHGGRDLNEWVQFCCKATEPPIDNTI